MSLNVHVCFCTYVYNAFVMYILYDNAQGCKGTVGVRLHCINLGGFLS